MFHVEYGLLDKLCT